MLRIGAGASRRIFPLPARPTMRFSGLGSDTKLCSQSTPFNRGHNATGPGWQLVTKACVAWRGGPCFVCALLHDPRRRVRMDASLTNCNQRLLNVRISSYLLLAERAYLGTD